jgi:trimethylamine-N-oxide reductase (cytochrome c)
MRTAASAATPENSAAALALAPRLFAHGTGNRRRRPTSSHGPPAPILDRLLLPESNLDGYAEWSGRGFVRRSIEQQFHRYHYPADGYAKMHLFYQVRLVRRSAPWARPTAT